MHGLVGAVGCPWRRVLLLGGQPGRSARGRLLDRDLGARQERGERLVRAEGVAPEEPEGALEDVPVLALRDEGAVQGPVELPPHRDVDGGQGAHGGDRVARSDGQAGGAQQAHEVRDVVGEAAGWGGGGVDGSSQKGIRRLRISQEDSPAWPTRTR